MLKVKKSDSMDYRDKKKDEIFKKIKENEKLLDDDIKIIEEDESFNISNVNVEKKQNIKFKYTWQIYLSCFFVLFVMLLVFIALALAPIIKLNGSEVVELNYQDEYKEPGYSLVVRKKDLTDRVKIRGKVDSSKLVTYKIDYY